ncbi:hypothetical protein SmJEL517_g03819 [Synchytrium microbalum]|uniref:Arginyl-tRNA--protein transferase 1 n=1 Tax=Synchytrium microbalum TaxID=1806994 RepID=A0A507C289_9FUNG|nr:uncharacterized protein SmJEL517_g03819 [Synchytrium microbalum]TPX33169.1 hypothetical protein SmJEL517_g03819 [Synchytrium microbalum]
MSAITISCQDYQDLIDRGWRRSGKYLYKPNLAERLDVNKYQQSKSHKKALRKVHKYLYEDVQEATAEDEYGNPIKKEDDKVEAKPVEEVMLVVAETSSGGKKRKSSSINQQQERKKKPIPMNARSLLEDNEINGDAHTLKVVLSHAAFEMDTYQLYRKYQIAIHKDEPSKLTESSFNNFLVESPIKFEPPASPSLPGYGSFHQKYYLDDTLIAVAVIDILPSCVSSVYLMYDPDYAFLGVGIYSAVRELAFAKTMHASLPDLHYYYMGFYIHTCTKMRYKGNYRPSDLLCPDQFVWVPLDRCLPELEKTKYVKLSTLLTAEEMAAQTPQPLDAPILDDDVDRIKLMVKGHGVLLLGHTNIRDIKEYRKMFTEALKLLGPAVSRRLIVQS